MQKQLSFSLLFMADTQQWPFRQRFLYVAIVTKKAFYLAWHCMQQALCYFTLLQNTRYSNSFCYRCIYLLSVWLFSKQQPIRIFYRWDPKKLRRDASIWHNRSTPWARCWACLWLQTSYLAHCNRTCAMPMAI